jgi:fructoselysine 6-kinase
MKLIGVGDNVLDHYMDQDLMYPGGNAVNVAVYARKLGVETAYLGSVGKDEPGRWLTQALTKEGVDVSRVKELEGKTNICHVALVEGDRTFVGSDGGASDELFLSEADFAYISEFDLVHSSIYSRLEDQLEDLSKASKRLTFDFSNDSTASYREKVLPWLTAAFFSGSDLSEEELEGLFLECRQAGVELCLVTRGSQGAILEYKGTKYYQGITPTEVVDTLGAGDGFIAALLVALYDQKLDPQTSMKKASEFAAKVCSDYGAFGQAMSY